MTVTFLSLGPGDPGLLTFKAAGRLHKADVVVVPATKNGDGTLKSRCTELISEWCDDDAMHLYALPMQKQREAVMEVYDTMCQDIQEWHHAGKKVVVVVEGDVSIYASIHYVMERLQENDIPVEQIPGIPSFIAAAASAGLSLICQNQRLVVLPGDADIEVLRRLLTSRHVVVVMKLSQCQQVLKDYLLQHPDAVCHYFENVGTTEEYHTSEHDEILSRRFPYFSLCILYPA